MAVRCPGGDLGVAFVDEPGKSGPRVKSVDPKSEQFLRVGEGWQLLSVNMKDVSSFSSAEATKVIEASAENERELIFAAPEPPPLVRDENGLMTILAPPGPLGMTFQDGDGFTGVVVTTVKAASPINSVQPSMTLRRACGVDVTGFNSQEVANLIISRAGEKERELVFGERPPAKPWGIGSWLLVTLVIIGSAIGTIFGGMRMYGQIKGMFEAAKTKELAMNAHALASKLGAKQELGMRPDFLQKVVVPAMMQKPQP